MISERVSPMLATWLNSSAAVDQLDAQLVAALDAEGEDRARAARAVLLASSWCGAGGRPGVGDPGDARVGLRARRRPSSALSTWRSMRKRQRLDARAASGRRSTATGRAEVAQADGVAVDGEGEIAEGLVEPQAVIGLGGSVSAGTCRLAQSNLPQSTISAADRIAVAGQILGHGVDDDVGAHARSGGRGTGVRRCCRRSAARRRLGAMAAIAAMSVTMPPGLASALDEDRAGLAASSASAKSAGSSRVDEAGLPAELREGVGRTG